MAITPAYLTMHTLKGAAGLLGAGEVQAMACQVEAALSSGRAVHPLLNDLDSALQRLQGCIDAALAMPVPENTTAPAAAAIPPATAIRNVPALLDQVGLLLGESNGAAIDMLEKYAAVLEKALGAAAWETIMAAAQDCDFACALAALQGARSTALR
jgi:chemotaxis protein histidine kinase CheA